MTQFADKALEIEFVQLLKSHDIVAASQSFAYKDIAAWDASASLEAALDKFGDVIFHFEDEGYFEFDEEDNAVLTDKGAQYLAEH